MEKYYNLADVLAWDGIKRAVERYGIEGTEQKIKELYKLMPVAQEKMLEVLYATYGIKKNQNR